MPAELDPRSARRLIVDGPSPAATSLRVIVVGAGMAGLAAADLLLRAGHEVVIVEARQRVGGRIETLRHPFSPGLYAEAGAMRIPRGHHLTLAYCERFGLPLQPFTASNPHAWCLLGGLRLRIGQVEADPASLPFELADSERTTPHGQLWNDAIADLVGLVRERGAAGWAEIAASHDQYSVREYLETRGWTEGAIERFGILAHQEALMNTSFLELLREEAGDYYGDLLEIDGGMDRLPNAFLPSLQHTIRFGARLVALDQDGDGVRVVVQTGTVRRTLAADACIVTVPFPVLRHVEVLTPFSRLKQRAIRQLRYDASAKVLLQFRRRFWEDDDGIRGGGSVTDLPIRACWYPDHGEETGRGVLLASYTWGEDAQRWGSLEPRDRLEQALEDLALLHPQAPEEFECGASKMWHDDPFAGGAFALFDPGQQTLLYDAICHPEGRIRFAGEHASLAHAWIQGAIESGLREALALHRSATA